MLLRSVAKKSMTGGSSGAGGDGSNSSSGSSSSSVGSKGRGSSDGSSSSSSSSSSSTGGSGSKGRGRGGDGTDNSSNNGASSRVSSSSSDMSLEPRDASIAGKKGVYVTGRIVFGLFLSQSSYGLDGGRMHNILCAHRGVVVKEDKGKYDVLYDDGNMFPNVSPMPCDPDVHLDKWRSLSPGSSEKGKFENKMTQLVTHLMPTTTEVWWGNVPTASTIVTQRLRDMGGMDFAAMSKGGKKGKGGSKR